MFKYIMLLAIAAGIALATSLTARTADAAGSASITYDVAVAWADTGIDVAAGETINVSASGSATYDAGHGNHYVSPDGDSPPHTGGWGNCNVHALVGWVGSSRPSATTFPLSGVMCFGSSFSGVSLSSGRLYVVMNDYNGDPGVFSDNYGSWSVTVSMGNGSDPCAEVVVLRANASEAVAAADAALARALAAEQRATDAYQQLKDHPYAGAYQDFNGLLKEAVTAVEEELGQKAAEEFVRLVRRAGLKLTTQAALKKAFFAWEVIELAKWAVIDLDLIRLNLETNWITLAELKPAVDAYLTAQTVADHAQRALAEFELEHPECSV